MHVVRVNFEPLNLFDLMAKFLWTLQIGGRPIWLLIYLKMFEIKNEENFSENSSIFLVVSILMYLGEGDVGGLLSKY